MKKILFVVVLLAPAVSAFADNGENLEKAGKEALEKREAVLLEKKAALEDFVWQAAEDSLVTKDEMFQLAKLTNDFRDTKHQFDKELKVYELETSTVIDQGYGGAFKPYFRSNALFKEDVNDTARGFFAEKTGKDVVIGNGAVFNGDAIIPLVFGSIFFCLFIVFLLRAIWGKARDAEFGAIVFFLLTAVLVIILLCW